MKKILILLVTLVSSVAIMGSIFNNNGSDVGFQEYSLSSDIVNMSQ